MIAEHLDTLVGVLTFKQQDLYDLMMDIHSNSKVGDVIEHNGFTIKVIKYINPIPAQDRFYEVTVDDKTIWFHQENFSSRYYSGSMQAMLFAPLSLEYKCIVTLSDRIFSAMEYTSVDGWEVS